jgi:hypothetical protein
MGRMLNSEGETLPQRMGPRLPERAGRDKVIRNAKKIVLITNILGL